MLEIFRIVERELQGDVTDSYKYYWQLAKAWVHQEHLQKIISDRLTYLQSQPEEIVIRSVIYNIIGDLEKIIRFRFAKNVRAYNDVLSIALVEKGYDVEAQNLVPLHLYLECGASRPVVLNLISIGLSRISALIIRNHILVSSESTPEDCMRALSNMNLDSARIPLFCRREILNLIQGRG